MTKRRRGLRPEEAALWEKVAGTARPLHATPPHPLPRPKPEAKRVSSDHADAIPTFRIGEAARKPMNGHVLQPGLSERLAGEPIRMDRKAFSRMARGKLKPEGKIDLHGMTLAEAHPALIRYVLRAHTEGRRLILVVTGKGRDRDDGGPIPAPRGILRHQVPQWLRQAPLGAVVLQVSEAHQRHGGGGAFYVYLRRQPGSLKGSR